MVLDSEIDNAHPARRLDHVEVEATDGRKLIYVIDEP